MKTIKHSLLLAAGVVVSAGLACTGSASANMITNGDFSSNAAAYTTYPGASVSPNPTNPTDWNISYTANGVTGGNAGINGTDTGFYSSQGAPFAPSSTNGVQDFLFMQGAADIPSVSQTVATTAGQTYTLSYAGAARGGETSDVLVVILTDATNSNQITTQIPAITDTGFNVFTLNFIAPSASTQVEFLNNTPNTIGGTVDVANVSLTPVPEPAALGILAVGGLGLVLIARKRQSRA